MRIRVGENVYREEDLLYHVTRTRDLPQILEDGLLPVTPRGAMDDEKGVYLFSTRVDMEDAVMNWLGDRFDEDEDLTLLTLSHEGVETHSTAARYEVISYDAISPENIVSTESI